MRFGGVEGMSPTKTIPSGKGVDSPRAATLKENQ